MAFGSGLLRAASARPVVASIDPVAVGGDQRSRLGHEDEAVGDGVIEVDGYGEAPGHLAEHRRLSADGVRQGE
jgi:hypothetical protein